MESTRLDEEQFMMIMNTLTKIIKVCSVTDEGICRMCIRKWTYTDEKCEWCNNSLPQISRPCDIPIRNVVRDRNFTSSLVDRVCPKSKSKSN